MSAPWRAVRVESCADREAVMAALFDAGSEGVHEDGRALVTHFPPGTDLDPILARVREADSSAVITTADAPAVDWSAWRATVGAHELGALSVVPPWMAEGRDPARTIVIDPAMAFGTGEHPTTRGMLRLMQGVIKPGDIVADLGAGSAVLSIAAIKLGASRVAAIELDPDSQASAEENLERNGVADLVTFLTGDAEILLPLVRPVRVVLANIVSSVLLELLPGIRTALSHNGTAILSGILVEEREMMLAALARGSWRTVAEDTEGDWWSVVIEPIA